MASMEQQSAQMRGKWKASWWPRCLWLIVVLVSSVTTDQTEEYLKREHSLSKPYQGVGSSPSSPWDLMGNVLVTPQYVRLTPDQQSKQGAIWNRMPCYLRDWELQVHFKVHGQGKKNLNGDGFAIWYTKDRMQPGPVFGSKDNFVGLGIFIDTYPNEEKQHEVPPIVGRDQKHGELLTVAMGMSPIKYMDVISAPRLYSQEIIEVGTSPQ